MPPDFVTDWQRHGDRPALVTQDLTVISYADLAGRVARFARRLGPGRKLVAIEAETTVEAIVAYLATLAGGHVAALLPAGDAAALARFRRDYAPEAVFARQGGGWRLTLDARPTAGGLHPDLALLLFTSGSTGQGKGVRLSARALSANAGSIAEYLALRPQDRAALVLPLHYAYGLSVLHSHLQAGASVWLAGGSMRDADFAQRMAQAGVSSLSTVPHGYELLERIGFFDALPVGLTSLCVAGGALRPTLQRDLARRMAGRGGRFFAMYGQTEAAARIAYLPPELAESHAGMIGQAIPGGELDLVDGQGHCLKGEGVEGELVYRGPNVMMGLATGRADLARGADLAALPTGDLARREGGLYRITGRKRRMSKIAGLRIGHDALESALAESGLAAAVWGDDRLLSVAYEAAGQAQAITAEGVAEQVARLAGLTCAHVRVTAVERLPRLPSGKLDYPALSQPGEPSAAGSDLLAAFRLAFAPRQLTGADSFTSLGGDSLRHVELAMALERHLGRLPEDWESLPLDSLCRLSPDGQGDAAGTVTVGSEHVVRAGAILAVVITHETGWPLFGGAAAMVVLIGLMLARFRRAALARGDLGQILAPLGRVLLPYYLILAGFALAWGHVPIGSALLISNFGIGLPVDHTRLPFLYWFVEAYAQMLALLAGLVLVPAIRRLVGARPMVFGLGLLAGTMGLRLVVPLVSHLGGQLQFTLPWVLYLLALGWMAGVAQGRQRWQVLALAAGVLPLVAWLGGNWYGAWIKYGMVFGVIALILFKPAFHLPRPVARGFLALASAAYLVYLTHRLVPNVLLEPFRAALPPWLFSALAVAGGLALGLGLAALARRAEAWTYGALPRRLLRRLLVRPAAA